MKTRFYSVLAVALLLCTSALAQNYRYQIVQDPADPGDPFTQLLGVNNSMIIAGYHNFFQNQGFVLTLPNNFAVENYPNSMMTQVIGINNNGTTDGFYVDQNGITHGFYRTSNNTFTDVDFPGTIFNQLLSQNDLKQAAGYYSLSVNNTTPDFPYIYDEQGKIFEVITIPGAVGGAQATGINNSQWACGFFIDQNQVNHGWLLQGGTFTQLDVPGSTFTQALGLNNNGQVVGAWIDGGGLTHGFLYTISSGQFTTIDEPDGVGTTIVNGINDNGVLVGFFGTAPINRGFVALPE
jgi:probable HAF family extracellular repeat protein